MKLQANKISPYIWIILAILIVYFQTLSFQFSLDDYLVFDAINGKINSFNDWFALFRHSFNNVDYRPLLMLSYGLENLILGEIKPGLSHFININLYIICIIISFNTLQLITKKQFSKIIFFSVLLFSVLPNNTEVVCSLKSRDNLFSFLFSMAALNMYVKFIYLKNIKYLLFSVILYFIGLNGKLDTIGLFLLVPGLYLLLNEASNLTIKRKIIHSLIYFIIFGCTSIAFNLSDLVTIKAINIAPKIVSFTENPLSETNNIFLGKLTGIIQTPVLYFLKIVSPINHRYYYGFNAVKIYPFFHYINLICFLFMIIVSSLSIYMYRYNKYILIFWLSYLCFGFYSFNYIVVTPGIIADRYIFIGSLFLCTFIMFSIYELSIKYNIIKFNINYIAIPIIILYIGFSTYRASAWKDLKTLVDRDAPHLTNSYEAMRIASSTYDNEIKNTTDISLQTEYLNKAIYYAEIADSIYPKNTLIKKYLSEYYFEKNEWKKAINRLNEAIKNNPKDYEAYQYLGDIYVYESSYQDKNKALELYMQSLEIQPINPVMVNSISTLLYEKDKIACLAFNYDQIQKDKENFAAYENLGYFYLDNNKDSSKYYFNKAIEFGLDANSIPSY